jgi:hypothetical protein
MGTTIVNILVSALPKMLPPRYKKQKDNRKRRGKIIFRQFKKVGMRQNSMSTSIIPLKGNLKRVCGF